MFVSPASVGELPPSVPAVSRASLGSVLVTADDMLNFFGAHPQMSVGILGGVVFTFMVHAIRRIKRLITSAVIMAVCGGGVASAGATDSAAQFAHSILMHLH